MAGKTLTVNQGRARVPTNADASEGRKSEYPKSRRSEASVVSSDPTISSFGGPESEVAPESETSTSGLWILKPEGSQSEEGASVTETPLSRSVRKVRPAAPKPRLKQRSLLREASSNAGLQIVSDKVSTTVPEGEVLGISSVAENVWQETWSIPSPSINRPPGVNPHEYVSASATTLQLISGLKLSEDNFVDASKTTAKAVERYDSETEPHLLHRVSAKSAFMKSASLERSKGKPHNIRSSSSAEKATIKSRKGKHRGITAEKKASGKSKDMGDSHRLGDSIPENFLEDTGMVFDGDSFKKIYESKSAIASSKVAHPRSGEITPSPSKGFVPSVSSPVGDRRHSGQTPPAAKYCPWAPRTILDAWIPLQTKFPSWITMEEHGTISKNMLKETKMGCKPRPKEIREEPSCCVLKEHERKTKVQLVSNYSKKGFRPEIRRWLLGYPQSTRFAREIQDLFRNPPVDVAVYMDDENKRHIYFDLRGPVNSLYEGGIFRVEVFFPGGYPNQPPKMRFMTKIYHPDVDKLGRIRLPAIEEKWCTSLLMRDVLSALKRALREPSVESAIAIDVARRWYWQETAARKTAQFWTKKYAHRHSAAAWLDCRCDCCCEKLAAASHFY